MRYALISDVHANLPALEAVLDDIARRNDVDAVFHLGDLVGYSSFPDEVVERLRSAEIAGVAGNYDSTIATDHPHCGCRAASAAEEELAHASYTWTRAHVSERTRSYLRALPFRIDLRPAGGHASGPTISLVHATPISNLVYVTADRSDDFLAKMGRHAGLRAGDALCFGHTHVPWHRTVGDIHFINTGSVGRPKDGDWRAGYVVLDASPPHVGAEFVRVEYDVARAVAGVRDSGLPAALGDFLLRGGRMG